MAVVTRPDPTSDLPKSWDPAEHEARLYQGWVDAGYFTADAESDKPAFSIVIPPPNVNGSLHMGHAYEHRVAVSEPDWLVNVNAPEDLHRLRV